MSFSAVTCLTYTGSTPLGGILNLYSDIDGFTTAFQTNINLSAITGNECPYYINNVPDGTNQIRIFDIGTGCYCDIPIQSNDLCVTYDLDFTTYSASTVGRLIAGDLTGTSLGNITDYRIFWYETGDTINPAYVSGFGSEFIPYSFTHPLTGSSSIFAQAGTYIPVIDKIKISGLTFSQTGGTGSIPAELECFSSATVTIDAFTCDNGTSNDPNYEHQVSFSGAAAGVVPQALESTFLLTATTTNYFAWKFRGYSVPDRLRLTYFGSAYSEPLIFEDIVVGSDLQDSDFSLNKIPKSAKTFGDQYFIKKVNCFTGITQTANDTIKLEVIPNSANTQTNWDFYFTCLDTFDQDSCIFNNFPYKISASTITSNTGQCNTNTIYLSISGCPLNTDDFTKYIVNVPSANIMQGYFNFDSYINPPSFFNAALSLYINSLQITNNNLLKFAQITCAPPSTNTITYKKYVSGGTMGVIDMEFSSINDFNTYYSSFLSVSTPTFTNTGLCSSASGPWSGTPFNSTDIRYYRYYDLVIPSNTGSTICGDGTSAIGFSIHPSTVVTTGTSGPNYTLRFTMPTVVNNLTYDPLCDYFYVINTMVNVINGNSTGTTNNFTGTTLTGSKYTDPFYSVIYACSGVTSQVSGAIGGSIAYPKYLNETIIYTGTTPTIVPSLSAKTFNFDYPRFTTNNLSNNLSYYNKAQFFYTILLNNPSDFRDFQIYANQITGGTFGSDILIYSYTGSTGGSTQHQPSYFI